MNNTKVNALAKYLNIEATEIKQTEYDTNSFVISPRQTKEGHAPEYYIETIKLFKALLSDTNSLDTAIQGGKATRLITRILERKATKAQKLTAYDKIAPLLRNKPVIKDWLHNENILYWLIKCSEDQKTYPKLRNAWLNKPIEDDREMVETNSGEYMVLTDQEADELWDQQLDSYIDDCILPEMPESAQKYFDREACKRDLRMDGRAHSLNSYDGTEYEEGGFYIYRTN